MAQRGRHIGAGLYPSIKPLAGAGAWTPPSQGLAAPVVVLSSQNADGGSSYAQPAAAAVTKGVLVAFVACESDLGLSFADSTGATWTRSSNAANHGTVAIFKRLVGANPLVSGTTTLTASASFGMGGIVVYVINLPDATSIPTSVDATGQMLWNGTDGAAEPDPTGTGDLGTGTGFTVQMPAPSAANSYQFAAFGTYGHTANIPGFGSDASWVNMAHFGGIGPSGHEVSIAYRKGPKSATGMTAETDGFTFQLFAWCEVGAPAGSDTGAGGGGGGGGAGGTISSAAQLTSVLSAGQVANGDKTYPLDTVDFGDVVLNNYNFSSHPIVFTGAPGTVFGSIVLNNCHGITFNTAKVRSYNTTYNAGIYVQGNCTDIIFNGVWLDSGAAEGSPNGAVGLYVRNGMASGLSNIQFIGRRDVTKPDVKGYGIGCSFLESSGGLFKDLTICNNGVDGIDLFGAHYVTVDGCLGFNFYSDVAGGEHPDWIQFAHYDTGRASNVWIKNCGFFVGLGAQPQGCFGDSCDNLTIENSWVTGTIYNTYVAVGCTNILMSDCFGQSTDEFGSSAMIRGGSDLGTITKMHIGAVTDYTEPPDPAHGQPNPVPNTRITIAGDNVLIGNRTLGDYTDLDVWLAAHPTARART